ncbi:adhesin [Staphylococcus simiae]|uniref:adhesin n=1 Tax=Staphylococcus simiae TaxID=308354 RepID=UPI001A96B028|nr:adhesin [Staphylococcus simiae]MBO1199020.1 adhesin [Staphylococcus simiae]MBO1201288.1 adhesin [Staphylococcus simiae]MBO1203468.1 adhesin [Staphylococcus simiae]MBO1210996.1 adhesin [Staphylococcus simiae]MBO1229626.1 adhesin [Staphylococcus simiae]
MAKMHSHPFKFYVKLTCSAMILSSSLMTVNISNHEAHAEDSQRTAVDEQARDKQLEQDIDDAKNDISKMAHLTDNKKTQFKKKLEKVTSSSDIDDIVQQANDDNKAKQQDTTKDDNDNSANSVDSTKAKNDNTEEKLDQFLADLDELDDKVDSSQQNDSTEEKMVTSHKDATKEEGATDDHAKRDDVSDKVNQALSDLDKIDQATKQENQTSNTSEINDQGHNAQSSDEASNNDNDVSKDEAQDTIKDLSKEDVLLNNSEDKANKISQQLQGSDKINYNLASKITHDSHQPAKQYTLRKLNALQNLDKQINKSDLSASDKATLKKEVINTKQSIAKQRQIILKQLANTKNKDQAVQNIVNSVFSKNEADRILNNITTTHQTDQQIADQIAHHIDGLTLNNSDDILKAMLDQSKDKEQLISQLLSTKLSSQEAQSLAKQFVDKKLTNNQIVDQLKRHFISSGKATADDILQEVINNAKDKRQAIETILATRIEQGKAKLLADLITKAEQDQSKMLSLVKAALNGKADDLLQLQQRLNQTKRNINDILSPITNRPSLLDRLNNRNSSDQLGQLSNVLNDGAGLLGGHSILDDIPDLPTPTPEDILTLGSGDGLLSGLLDDDGNISLPKTGEAIKHHWLPLSVILLSAGLAIIGLNRYHRRKHS